MSYPNPEKLVHVTIERIPSSDVNAWLPALTKTADANYPVTNNQLALDFPNMALSPQRNLDLPFAPSPVRMTAF